jgi:Isocitrate/isopropylmalate dehydrogenase
MLSRDFDAILAGAFGDPRVPSNKHAEDILLGMRRGLDLYINLVRASLHQRLTPLQNKNCEATLISSSFARTQKALIAVPAVS